jgi:hypothetical protein
MILGRQNFFYEHLMTTLAFHVNICEYIEYQIKSL